MTIDRIPAWMNSRLFAIFIYLKHIPMTILAMYTMTRNMKSVKKISDNAMSIKYSVLENTIPAGKAEKDIAVVINPHCETPM